MPDDAVVEQLQTAMTELRSKKLDQPPPGAPMFFYRLSPPHPKLLCPQRLSCNNPQILFPFFSQVR